MSPLPANQFASVIRAIHTKPLESVVWLRTVTYFTLRRLGVFRDTSKAYVGRLPHGSDQLDTGSLRDWMEQITKEDAAAIEQVLVIDATCTARVGGR